jgi:hypothetical protein
MALAMDASSLVASAFESITDESTALPESVVESAAASRKSAESPPPHPSSHHAKPPQPSTSATHAKRTVIWTLLTGETLAVADVAFTAHVTAS